MIAGRYEVTGVLGEGGTGVVYDAIRREDGKPVALKVMHAELAGDEQVRGRFRREAAILERLSGPHICPILDHGEVPGDKTGRALVYLAMERLEGPTLERVMEEERLLPVDRALDLVLDVLTALRAAHEQGVIHRDLKPANVILEGRSKVVVVDFGMAKIVTGGGTGTTNLTTHNMVFGTPEYMSPELARGEDLDARCDVYAVGVMLYELLTGEKPFTAPTPLGTLTAHLTADLVLPSARAPGRVTPALESVIVQALARDRDQRYPTAAALAAAVTNARTLAAISETDAFAKTAEVEAVVLPTPAPPPAVRVPSVPVAAAPKSSPVSSGRVTPPPSGRPSTRPSAPPARRDHAAQERRQWALVWVLVLLVSVGAGVALAHR